MNMKKNFNILFVTFLAYLATLVAIYLLHL